MPGPQEAFILSEAMYPGFFGGRGAGKTVAGALKMWHHVTRHPGANGAIGLPNYDDIEKILLPTMRDLFGPPGSDWGYLEKKKQIVFPQLGSRAFILTAEEPEARGANLAWFWLDEIGKGTGFMRMFLNLQPALRQFGDGYDAYQGWVTSTPQVERPWVKQIWAEGTHPITEREIDNWKDRYPIFRARTVDNLNLPSSIRETLLHEWGGTRMAKQELEGEFISVTGIVFPELSESLHLRRPPPDTEFIATVVGIDFGQVEPTAMLEIKQDRSRKLWVTREFYKRNATSYDWLNTLAEWNTPLVFCDPSASQKDIQHWRQKWNINIKASKDRRHDRRMELWRNLIVPRQSDGLPGIYISPECQNTWNELTNLAVYTKKGSEVEEQRFSQGTLDHAYDAGAYALGYFEHGYIGRPQVTYAFARSA